MANMKVNMSMTKKPMPEQDPVVRAGNFDEVALGYTAEDAIAAAKADPAVAAALEGKQLVKEIYVKGRLVNLAAKG